MYHTVGVAADVDSLPTAVAGKLAERIIEIEGVVPGGDFNPELEKKFADMVQSIERSEGPLGKAVKQQMRKALGLQPAKVMPGEAAVQVPAETGTVTAPVLSDPDIIEDKPKPKRGRPKKSAG